MKQTSVRKKKEIMVCCSTSWEDSPSNTTNTGRLTSSEAVTSIDALAGLTMSRNSLAVVTVRGAEGIVAFIPINAFASVTAKSKAPSSRVVDHSLRPNKPET